MTRNECAERLEQLAADALRNAARLTSIARRILAGDATTAHGLLMRYGKRNAFATKEAVAIGKALETANEEVKASAKRSRAQKRAKTARSKAYRKSVAEERERRRLIGRSDNVVGLFGNQ